MMECTMISSHSMDLVFGRTRHLIGPYKASFGTQMEMDTETT